MSGRPPIDDELDDLFEQPSDVAFAQRLHEAPHRAVEADPAFKEALRRRLMQEAWRQQRPHRPWYRRLLGPPGLAWAGVMAGVLLIVFATVVLSQSTRSDQTIFTSPINGSRSVATTSAIVVDFQQPMNPSATQAAAQITPATEVTYRWSNNNQTLTITPKNDGLAPGEQYQVTFDSAVARTASNEPLSQTGSTPSPITFVTAETPTPTPTPTPAAPTSPAPSPTSTLLSGVVELGPSEGSQPVWSLDGSTIYVLSSGGALTSYANGGGSGTTIAPSGVSQVVAGPNGPAYVSGSTVTYAGQTTTVPNLVGIGFENTSQLMSVAGTSVAAVGGTGGPVALSATPDGPPVFDASGTQLAYLSGGNLHVVDLSAGTDQSVGNATTLGSWSPDGSQFAFVQQASLQVVGASGQNPTTVSGLSGVTAVDWTNNGLLVSSKSGLVGLTSPSATATDLTGAADSAGAWSPASALVGYVSAGEAYVAKVSDGTALAATTNAVTTFMAARQGGNSNEAQQQLAPAAQAAYANGADSNLYLIADGSATINRWSFVLAQASGTVVVRTVFSQGTQESVFDEQFQVQSSANGQYLIAQVQSTPIAEGSEGGPSMLGIQPGSTTVSITFDSDVNPATVQAGVVLVDSSGTPLPSQSATYDASTRTVTVTVSGGFASGPQYGIQISSALKDVDGHGASKILVGFTSPTTPASPVSPSPSASPSPGG